MAFTENGVTITNNFALYSDYSKFITPYGTAVQTIGNNAYGQLGLSNITNRSSPVTVSLYDWNDVSVSKTGQLIAYVDKSNMIYASGATVLTSSPNQISSSINWTDISAGFYNTIAVGNNSSTYDLYTWGNNSYGSLGVGDTSDRMYPTYTTWSSSTPPKLTASGRNHMIAVFETGYLVGLGRNNFGQLGNNTTTNYYSGTAISNNFKEIATGHWHSIGIKTDGTLWGWGNNSHGQLGIGNLTHKSSPTQVGVDNTWSAVACGYSHTLAIKTDGTLWGWGNCSFAQLGFGSTRSNKLTPVQIGTATNWKSVSSFWNSTLAVTSEGTLLATGSNTYGVLGTSDTSLKANFTQVGTDSNWSQVSIGIYHAGGVKTDGTLWTWGYNISGQLGLLDSVARSTPTKVGTDSDWTKVSAGYAHTASLKANGTLWTCGLNTQGTLGSYIFNSYNVSAVSYANVNQTKKLIMSNSSILGLDKFDSNIIQLTDDNIPNINASTSWKTASAGDYHFVGINTNGTAWAVGNNEYGQLGLSDTTFRRSIVQIGARTDWSKVFCGDYTTMLVDNSMNAYVFGKNNYGQLGTSDLTNRSSPVQITGIQVLSADLDDNNSWIIDSNKNLWQAGLGNNNYWGLDAALIWRPESSPVQIGNDWKDIVSSLQAQHCIGIKTDGTLWVWGNNSSGVLGLQDKTHRFSPVQLGTDSNWSVATLCKAANYAIKTDGTLWGWGSVDGQNLGLNTSSNAIISTPVQIGLLNDWSKVSAGGSIDSVASCYAIKTDGTLWVWGYNPNGVLGLNTTTSWISSPVQVGADTNWAKISIAQGRASAIKTNGTLWVCGYASSGPLGVNTTASVISVLTQVGTDSDWNSVVMSSDWMHATKTNGTLWAWGANDSGQLGNNTSGAVSKVSFPTQIGALTNWKEATGSSWRSSYAVKTDGTIWGWGYNALGQLGLNTTTNYVSPMQIGTLTNWSKMVGQDTGSYMLNSSGVLYSTGANTFGNLGTFINYKNFKLKQTDFWSSVSAGGDNALFIKSSGSVWAAGNNSYGSLGLVGITTRSSPVQIGVINNVVKAEIKNNTTVLLLK